MISDKDFNLEEYPLKGAIDSLNGELAALGIEPGESLDETSNTYGCGVFGIRFGGNTRLGALMDGVSRVLWPEDKPAVAPHTAEDRKHLVVAANYPDGVTKALQFFTTINPGKAAWIQEEQGELKRVADKAVNIDSSARLIDKKGFPPGYGGPVSAYLMNLYWLVVMEQYPMAILEVNEKMKHSLTGNWGIELGQIVGAEPRTIGGKSYERFIIDPSSESNAPIVDIVRQTPPVTFRLTDSGLAVTDDNRSRIAA